MVLQGLEPRQTTSNIGHINKPSIQALIHGLNRHYYSIAVNYRKTELEQAMLMNLHKRNWTEGLTLRDFNGHKEANEKAIKVRPRTPGQSCDSLADRYNCACIYPVRSVRHPAGLASAVNALALGSVQQVGAGRVYPDCGPAQDSTRRQAGSQTPSGGRG